MQPLTICITSVTISTGHKWTGKDPSKWNSSWLPSSSTNVKCRICARIITSLMLPRNWHFNLPCNSWTLSMSLLRLSQGRSSSRMRQISCTTSICREKMLRQSCPSSSCTQHMRKLSSQLWGISVTSQILALSTPMQHPCSSSISTSVHLVKVKISSALKYLSTLMNMTKMTKINCSRWLILLSPGSASGSNLLLRCICNNTVWILVMKPSSVKRITKSNITGTLRSTVLCSTRSSTSTHNKKISSSHSD